MLAAVSAIFIIPVSRQVFVAATNAHPYLMGFAKFVILATMGEMLAVRILTSRWSKPLGMIYKALFWGVAGMAIVFVFNLFTNGITGMLASRMIIPISGIAGAIIKAFLISATLNLTFAPVFMAVHRISDTFIDLRVTGTPISLSGAITRIDWPGYIHFVVAKTIPFFWIPAHTLTFLLPPEYRVLAAAYLSIALGIILAYARRRKPRA
jgi:hypothetical protein